MFTRLRQVVYHVSFSDFRDCAMKLFSVFICLSWLCLPVGTALAAVPQGTTVTAQQTECESDISTLSPEELKWYKTFQEGTFLIEGWKDITRKILANTPVELREHQRRRLEQLGRKIGMEWSRENAVRKVDNKMLKQWGDALKKAAKTNPEHLPNVIASIDEELDNLLN